MQECFANGNGNVGLQILSMHSSAIVYCKVKSSMPLVNCIEKYTAINQRQLGAGSGPMVVKFACCG